VTLLLTVSSFSSWPRPANAQGANTTAKIGAIRVTGAKTITAAQVIAATGLKSGQPFHADDLNAIAERLGKSGAFSDITYTYVPQGGTMAIEFKVQEAKFRACHFDNFVWLSQDEIDARLKKDLPLYNGMAPETGDLLDEIPAVLEGLSKEKGVIVHVSRRIEQLGMGDPNWSHLYYADGANAKVQALGFTGNQTIGSQELEKQAGRLLGLGYSIFQSELFAAKTIVPYYRDRGYLQVKVEVPAAKILSHAERTADYAMQVEYSVTEGSVYHWAPAEWSGDLALDAAGMEGLTGMKATDVAGASKMEEGWQGVRKEYSKTGYLEVKISPEPVFDEEKKLVHYRVSVTEGPQYRMGTFAVLGVPEAVVEKMKGRWKLKTGDVYDGTYANDFMKKEGLAALQGTLKQGTKIGMMVTPNRDAHTVDVAVKVG
jgi:outer membrane protein assembly factor BamA